LQRGVIPLQIRLDGYLRQSAGEVSLRAMVGCTAHTC
jgi:hypothetical protein